MAEVMYYMMCGQMGNNVCFRQVGSQATEEERFTCDVEQAMLFHPAQATAWNSVRSLAGLPVDKPIPEHIVIGNTRSVFTIEHGILDEDARVTLIRFWKHNGFI